MAGEEPSTVICTVVAVDPTNFCYRVCSVCEKTLPDKGPSLCKFCDIKGFNPGSSSFKRLYRVLLSVATENKVSVVICFDRAARVLFGCSADEFFEFRKLNPFSAVAAGKVLEGEMFQMTLSKPKNGNAQHLRVVSVFPLRSDFSPAINTLKKLYGVGQCACNLENGLAVASMVLKADAKMDWDCTKILNPCTKCEVGTCSDDCSKELQGGQGYCKSFYQDPRNLKCVCCTPSLQLLVPSLSKCMMVLLTVRPIKSIHINK